MATVRDSSLPSIWGQHGEALFNPVMVKNKLITTVERAPADWSARLDDLGFKKGSRAWLRVGPVTQSEFQYLSPSIILTGFRPEDLVNAQEEAQVNPVPLSVQDEIVKLWQSNLDAVLFEMSFHDVTSKAVAWSHVESALAGDSTPEADAVAELAFARMRHQKTLVGDALDYAAIKGWGGVDLNQAVPRGKCILHSGDTVNWADSEGVIHKGRLAMPLRVGDAKVWVYEGGPRFVGGISASTLGQVSRQQVQFLDAGEEWSRNQSVAAGSELANTSTAPYKPTIEFRLADLSNEAGQAVVAFLKTCIYFPQDRWKVDLSSRAKDDDALAVMLDEVQGVLESIESNLHAVSQHYYGPTGIGFCLAKNRSMTPSSAGLAVRIGSYNGLGFYSVTDSVTPAMVLDNGLIHYDQVASELDEQLRLRIAEFERDAQSLGAAAGVESAIPLEFYRGYRVTNALNELESSGLGSNITQNQLMSIITVAGDKYGVAKEALYGIEKGEGVSLTLFNYPVPSDVRGMSHGQLSLGISHDTVSLVSVADILRELQSPTHASIQPIDAKLSFAQMSMSYESSEVADLSRKIPHLTCTSPKRMRIIPLENHADAVSAMEQVLEALSVNDLVGERTEELAVAKLRLDSFPLVARFHKAIEATKNADESKVAEWVKNELMRSFQGRITEWSESGFQRVIKAVTNNLRGNQGVVVALAALGQKKKYYTFGVPGTDDAVLENRDAVLGKAMVQTKEKYKLKAKFAVFDAISFSDPELCSLIAGERSGLEKVVEGASGDYQDTGVVAGYARKDIRNFSRDDLLLHAGKMSAEQKEIYVKRELIWPRTSFEEMKEKGLHLHTAIAIDTLWKSLPKAPKSLATEHVKAFTDLIAGMRDGTADLIEKVKSGELPDTERHDTKFINGALLDIEFKLFTRATCQSDSVKGVYKEIKVRGMPGLKVGHYSPFTDSASMRSVLKDATWDDHLKSKKVTRPASGSRVMRGDVVRVGDDYRKGVSVISEDFLKTFGFSGVEYGNWTNQKEREKHLNLSYDSMMDFASVLGWEPMALSLGGRLGLCIGSRGEGGSRSAAAHFEPANYAINLTRMSGDGSLAHEYFHALANHFGHIHTGKPQDLLDTFSYSLQRPGALPIINESSLREPVRSAFRDLQVAIMRKPAPGTDPGVIGNYVELSDMMASSKDDDYLAQPAEMFARAMEVWFADQLQYQGKRNDYLVADGKGGASYPNKEHLERINKWVSPLLEAVELEVRKVTHPILGDIEMPVLHSEERSSFPLSAQDIVDLGMNELNRLFERSTPKFMLFNEEGAKAGFYSSALDVLALNEQYADRETFYHEAWHACEAKLLTADERLSLQTVFRNDGPLSLYVTEAMRMHGLSEVGINAAMESPSEMQAYAFQMWSAGKLDLSEQRLTEFYKVRGFVDGVTEVAALLGGEKAKSLFSAFMTGELAIRNGAVSGLAEGRGITLHLPLPPEVREIRETSVASQPSMRMG